MSPFHALELRALLLMLQRLRPRLGPCCSLLVGVDGQVVCGAVSRGRSPRRVLNRLLRKLCGLLLLRMEVWIRLVWLPTWANAADAPSHGKPVSDRVAGAGRFRLSTEAVTRLCEEWRGRSLGKASAICLPLPRSGLGPAVDQDCLGAARGVAELRGRGRRSKREEEEEKGDGEEEEVGVQDERGQEGPETVEPERKRPAPPGPQELSPQAGKT